jgi:hypothetical protein
VIAGGFAALLPGWIAMHFGPWRRTGGDSHLPPRGRCGELAAEQRRRAADACRGQHSDECERALDRAAQLDAQGDRAEEVAALRAAIAAGRREAGRAT